MKSFEARNFEQCHHCTVTVSQTKSGVALQFEYVDRDNDGRNIYTSIDLIPVFQIEPINTMDLARLIVRDMLSEDAPEGWLNFMFKYAKDYKVIQEISESGNGKITSVGLKTMTFYKGRNHHIKPAQEFTNTKFSSTRMRHIYSYIKFLKKVFHLDLSSYWVKKELTKPEYQSILDSCRTRKGDGTTVDDFALIHVLLQPEFKTKLECKINFLESQKRGFLVFHQQIRYGDLERVKSLIEKHRLRSVRFAPSEENDTSESGRELPSLLRDAGSWISVPGSSIDELDIGIIPSVPYMPELDPFPLDSNHRSLEAQRGRR